jgi:shikimate kinase
MILKLVRTPGIYLVGFVGSGKTTIGTLLADRLGWEFIDLDAEIEAGQKMSIADIFDRYGEECFRRIETEAIRMHLRMVRSGRPAVIALGGGAFARRENRELLEDNGVTVWLDCPLELARTRVAATTERPLARDPAQFERLYATRRDSYARADYRVEIDDDSAEAVVDRICALPIFD